MLEGQQICSLVKSALQSSRQYKLMLKITKHKAVQSQVIAATSGKLKRPGSFHIKVFGPQKPNTGGDAHFSPLHLIYFGLNTDHQWSMLFPFSSQTLAIWCYCPSPFQGISSKIRCFLTGLKQCEHSSTLSQSYGLAHLSRTNMGSVRPPQPSLPGHPAPTKGLLHFTPSGVTAGMLIKLKGWNWLWQNSHSAKRPLQSSSEAHHMSLLHRSPGTKPRPQCAQIIWSLSSYARLGRN